MININNLIEKGITEYSSFGGLSFTQNAVFERTGANTSSNDFDKAPTSSEFGSNLDQVMYNQLLETVSKFEHFGTDNMLHVTLLELITNNSILAELLLTKAKFIKGTEVIPYRVVNGRQVEITEGPVADFFYENDIDELMFQFAMDLAYWDNIVPEYIFNRAGNKINRLTHKPMHLCRISKNRKVIGHANWDLGLPKNLKLIPVFNEAQFRAGRKYKKAAQLISLYQPGSTCHGFPNYLYSKNWIDYSNQVPIVKLLTLKKSSKIKYHIQYPEDYFQDRFPSTEINPKTSKPYCQEDWDKIEKAVHLMIDKKLSNISETESTIMTAIQVDYQGNTIEWKITPIKTQDDTNQHLEGWQNSHDAITSSVGIPPELASIRTGDKLGAGGSAVKNLYNVVVEKFTPERRLITKPLRIIQKINGWDRDIRFGARQKELVSTDESKDGKAKEESIS